ncbi:MAG: PAS domain S-box protein [Oscillatoriophycideae cyanobacterium NC_groundwater_1537_Pr4_S-0.65um_50_18]|nr:PAS domain S-box protein [Oscillatoriophycideae cyanobacterium NC_groundwater_1537_Pr4_S-0.65um_50_18]
MIAPEQQTLLIVDDSPEDRELYQRYLLHHHEYAYTFLEASLGQQGLDLWQQHRPAAVLLDYRLPDLDGLEFLSRLRSLTQQPHLPAIMVTGQGSEAIAVQAMKAGAQDYLIKEQITPEGLHLAIHGAIETVKLRTELQQRIERERVVGHITRQIHQSLDFDGILQTTVTEVRQFLKTDRVLVFQLQPDGNGTVVAESVGEWQSLLSSSIYDPCLAQNYLRFSRPESLNLDPAFAEDYVRRYRQGQVTAIPDIHGSNIDPCHIELLAQFQVKANLVVPILHDDRFWGLLIAHHCAAPRFWQPLEIDLLKELATQLGIALRQAELYQQSQSELAERNRVEAELRESEERLRSALEASRMGTWDWNIATGQIQWSDNLEAMFGLEAGAFDGSFQMFSERLHPDDRDRVMAAVEQAIATGEDYEIEFRVVYPNSTVRWALSQGKVFYDRNGQPIRMAGNDIDITDRKLAEIALRESEQRYATLSQISPVGIFRTDVQGDCLYINARWCELTGLSPEAAQGKGWVSALHPDDRDRVFAEWYRATKLNLPFSSDYRFQTPDGTVSWVIGQAIAEKDVEGHVVGYVGTVTDISDRKHAEHSLQASEEQFRQLAENIDVVFWMKEVTEDRVSYVSPAYERLWQLNPQQLYESQQAWIDYIHPDDRESVDQAFQAKATAGLFDEEYRIILPNGRVRWVHDRCFPLQDEAGSLYRFTGIAEDITDRKQIEEMLRLQAQVLDQTHDTVVSTDLDGNITSWNKGAERVFGYTAEEVLGRSVTMLYPSDQHEVFYNQVLAPLKANGEHEVEVVTQRKSGERFDLLLSLSLLRNEHQQPIGMIGFSMDITERKRTAEALRQNEQLLRLALTGAQAGSWDWEILTNKVVWSSENFDLHGLTPTPSLQYEDWANTLHPDDRERINAETWRCIEEKQAEYRVEFRVIHPQRGIRWLQALGRLIVDDQGEPIRLSGINLDITDRKLAEDGLQQSEAFNRRILESSSDCIKLLTLNGQLLYMNPGGLCMMEIDDIRPYISADWASLWQEEMRETVEAAIATAQTGELTRFQGFCPTAKGTPKWWDVVVTPILNSEGQGIQLLATSRDITERIQSEAALRQSEERFRTLADNMSQFAWMAHANGDIFWYNQRWFNYTGTTLEEMQGWGWQKVHHPDHVDRVVQHIRHCFETGQPWEDTFPLRGQDGQYRWFLSRAIPIRSEQGEIACWFGTNTDITERKQSEMERDRLLEQEQAARASAERANRIKDEFLAVLSHELRSPLNPILSWTKLMQMRKFDPTRTAEALATIERNVKIQTQLIDDLLDVAKILRGKLSMNETPVDLAFVIEQAIDTVRTAAVAKKITLHAELPQIGRVSGDAARLQQIIWNLLSNAIKFTPTGRRVDIWLERMDNQAQIVVSDTGKGINPDFLPHIFESFRQEDASTTRRYGGLGLGLAIVRHLVEAHGGTIWANSQGEGQGATFTVQLPLLDTKPETVLPKESSTDELNLEGIRVMAVDDDPDARDLLVALLQQYGAEVSVFSSAAEVLANLAALRPDVLVSDIGMPGIDGYSLIRQVRALPPEQGGQTPAIALTAYAREGDHQQAINSGYQRHITKPLDPEELAQAITTLMQQNPIDITESVDR